MARHSSAIRRSSVPKVRTSKYFSYFENDEREEVRLFSSDYSLARDATVCVITIGDRSTNEQDPSTLLEQNLNIFKDVIPKVCKYAPNSILLIVTAPGIFLLRFFFFPSFHARITNDARFSRHTVVRGNEALRLPAASRGRAGHVFGQL